MDAEPIVRMGAFTYAYPGAAGAALAEIELELAEGELAILAGRSGCGKSTLLRACCGLVPHYHGGEVAGTLEVCGLDVRDHGPGGARRAGRLRRPGPRDPGRLGDRPRRARAAARASR